MRLSAARNCYYSHSGNASAAARQIAFAGIAVVWVFNKPLADRTLNLPEQLAGVLLLLCIALALDLLQYTLSTSTWGFWSRRNEKQLKHKFHDDPSVEPPAFLKIGKATWLERVCQNVEFSVVAGTEKKKT